MKAGDVAKVAARFRAQKPLTNEDASTKAEEWVKSLLPSSLNAASRMPDKIDARPATFGMSKDYDAPGSEPGWQSCVRINLQGTRFVAMIHLGKLVDMLCCPNRTMTLADLKKGFKGASKEQLEAVCAGSSSPVLFHATVGPGESLWVPAGFVMYERTMDDVFGLRCALLFREQFQQYEQLSDIIERATGEAWALKDDVLKATSPEVAAEASSPADKGAAAAAAAAAPAAAAEEKDGEHEKKAGESREPQQQDDGVSENDPTGGANNRKEPAEAKEALADSAAGAADPSASAKSATVPMLNAKCKAAAKAAPASAKLAAKTCA